MPVTKQIVIVANRLPFHRSRGRDGKERWSESPGGLVTAVRPVFERRGGYWVGWSGVAGKTIAPFEFEGIRTKPVKLTASEVEHYYHRFSNTTLWPLYHDAIRTPEFQRESWEPYISVNERFAKAAARVAPKNALVWVHDYQLQLVPSILRNIRPDLRIGFFLHIPFPPEELFAWLPWRRQILEGLLGADLVGFQTHGSARNFSRVAREYTAAEGTDTELDWNGRAVRVGSFPVSIDFRWYEELAKSPKITKAARTIREQIGKKRRVILCIDRMDYTKGIELRLLAMEELLKRKTVSVDECVLVQIAVPSREGVRDYAKTRSQVEHLVASINGDFSEPGKVAVHYFRRSFPRDELIAYYLAADVMLVTPLRDGMNLVAKEYVACRTDNTGVLVLSEFAGAARELRRSLLVNPRDIDSLASTIELALAMPRGEARQRMAVSRMTVRRHDVHYWAQEFLDALNR